MPETTGIGLSQRETFRMHFPSAQVDTIAIDNIPAEIVSLFESKSRLYLNTDHYTPRNFTQCYVVFHDDGSKTYLARQTKTYDTNHETEELTYLVDTDQQTTELVTENYEEVFLIKATFLKTNLLLATSRRMRGMREKG